MKKSKKNLIAFFLTQFYLIGICLSFISSNGIFIGPSDNNKVIRFGPPCPSAVYTIDLHDMPIQPDNFTIVNGTLDSTGDLETTNGDSTAFDSESKQGSIDERTAHPNWDLGGSGWTQSTGSTIYETIDEVVSPDGQYINGTTIGDWQEVELTTPTLPSNSYISRIEVQFYVKKTSSNITSTSLINCKYRYGTGAYSSDQDIGLISNSAFGTEITQWAGLNDSRTQAANLRIHWEIVADDSGDLDFIQIDMVRVYVEYTELIYSANVTCQWGNFNNFYFETTENLRFSFSCSEFVEVGIYDWSDEEFDLIYNGTGNSFATQTQDLTNLNMSRYVNSVSFDIRVNFQAIDKTTLFSVEVDMLRIDYLNYILPETPVLTVENAGIPDPDGTYSLVWTGLYSDGVDVYRNGGILASGETSPFIETDMANGTYEYYVVALNSRGISPNSNTVIVEVVPVPANDDWLLFIVIGISVVGVIAGIIVVGVIASMRKKNLRKIID